MIKKYSINDLVTVLGVSRTAVNRKVEKHGFEIVQEQVNGKLLKHVCLTMEQIEALKKEIDFFKGDNTVSKVSHDTKLYNDTPKSVENIETTNNLVESMLKELRHYADMAIQSEKEKVLLIEDKARTAQQDNEYYKSEIARLTQEITQLQNENKTLQEQLTKKSGFLGLFKK